MHRSSGPISVSDCADLTDKQTNEHGQKQLFFSVHNSCACGFSTIPTPALFSEGIITLIGSSSAWYWLSHIARSSLLRCMGSDDVSQCLSSAEVAVRT